MNKVYGFGVIGLTLLGVVATVGCAGITAAPTTAAPSSQSCHLETTAPHGHGNRRDESHLGTSGETLVCPLQITTSALPGGTLGANYSASLSAANGVQPYRWSIVGGQLPPGLSLHASTGEISGMPRRAGAFKFLVQVTDSSGQTASNGLSIRTKNGTALVPTPMPPSPAPSATPTPDAPAPTVSSVFPNSGPSGGGTSVTINGSNFQTGATVFFGGVSPSSVTVVTATQVQATTPPGRAGTVAVAIRNPGGQTSVLPNAFTYTSAPPSSPNPNPDPTPLPSGARVYFSSSFEKGTLSPLGPWLGNGTGTVTITSEQAHSGTHSVKLVNPIGEWQTALAFAYPNPNPTRYQVDPNGLYQSWWFWIDQASIDNIVNAPPRKGQLKYNSNRTNESTGRICPGSWITDGWAHGENTALWQTWDICNGLNVQVSSVPVTASIWHHVQTWFLHNDTSNAVNPLVNGVAMPVPANQGRAILWLDGAVVYDHTGSWFGAPCTPTSQANIDGTIYTCAGSNAGYYPNDTLSAFFGNYVVEDSRGPVTMYVDDLEAADQYIPDASAAAPIAGPSPSGGSYNYATECQDSHPDYLFCDDFETGDLSKWDSNGDGRKNTVTSNPANVAHGNNALQATLDSTGGAELDKWWMSQGADEVYVRFYIKFEAGFQDLRGDGNEMHLLTLCGNTSANQWSCYGQAGVQPNGSDFFTSGLEPGHNLNDPTLRPFVFYSYWPGMNCGGGNPNGGCYGNLVGQNAPAPLLDNRWYSVETHIKLNTPGASDGVQELWIDGVKKVSQTGMHWRNSSVLQLNNLRFELYMPGAPKTEHIYIDNIVVSKSWIQP